MRCNNHRNRQEGQKAIQGSSPHYAWARLFAKNRLIEGWPMFDALYMTVITLTTVGFREVHELSPYVIGGARVAQAVLRPNVVEFLELATRTEHLELNIEEARIGPGSSLANARLEASALGGEHGLIIVAIKKTTGRMTFNPPRDAVLEVGDVLIMLGGRRDLDRVAALAVG